ncbi:acetyl-CoA acetyltransferase [Pseudoteredinibacter isoporae]|uniref:Acetyl-CoA C-acetyltransferase n=1 Tax=Pseudoteredinibacter isoporae TaxID=570281 RepID=A0A7X0JWR2_9GAMM|nr:acetyl-CoA acetyltransferase [Pseudoteredinibacter isoporae]MBB6522925.1 acetyl-CoA C-acetyltransferase [Pseudoteredinibacter isoporae]NHO88451.1 thiolase domain-containing protein [Pseudoteredinibacter isoporae]NIB23218.1 thiolase domain-containing protein [Pseudoteredinibacter isoporae]
MPNDVFILGGAQSDFARNWSRQGLEIGDMMEEVVRDGLSDSQLNAEDIQCAHVGNFVGELFCGQGMLGGVLAQKIPEFRGLPISRHEAACASGSMAILAAMADIESGRYESACVLGVEYMRNVPGDKGAEYLGSAAWTGHEGQGVTFMWPHMFSELTLEYEKRYGIDYAHLGEIARINYDNARLNPNSQSRAWEFAEGAFGENDELNPVISGRVRRNDCGQITDGAAVVFLASKGFAEDYAKRNGLALDSIPRIKGWGHTTAGIAYADKITASAEQQLVFPHVNQAIQQAFKRANVELEAIDAIETHDCFAMTEYMAIDHFGITPPGESWKVIEAGDIAMGGRLPINPSGGLIGLGHPVGATGVRMMLDAYKQSSNQADSYQVANAKNIATLNIGGSATTTASFVVGV